jgi:hypothetical protein
MYPFVVSVLGRDVHGQHFEAPWDPILIDLFFFQHHGISHEKNTKTK